MPLTAYSEQRDPPFRNRVVEPKTELGAYEALWDTPGASFKSIAELFAQNPGAIPSDLVDQARIKSAAREAIEHLVSSKVFSDFGIRVHGAGDYPKKLRDARHPIELLYYRGWWDLAEARSVAIVGSRKPSTEGVRRARKLAKLLTEDGFTIASGLATGIDAAAHLSSIEHGGSTIAVIGTPITECYPRENRELQEAIARAHLLISQVPIVKYSRQGPKWNRLFFPERNVTMSALTEATVIVEASDTSGTLIQARAALQQGRKLFILESCFNRPGLKWPHTYEKRGAIRVRDIEDIRLHLGPAESPSED